VAAATGWSERVAGREFHPPKSKAFGAHYDANRQTGRIFHAVGGCL
jgi:hypothetical protein